MGTVSRRALAAVILLVLAGCSEPPLPVQPTDGVPLRTREFSLSGVVEDVMSRPVADCRVEIMDGPRAGTFVTTSAGGRFEMPGVFSGPITVRTSKEGFISATKTVDQPQDGRPRLLVSFALDFADPSAALYTLSGTVTEPGGPALAGVRVSTSTSAAVTDSSGRYAIAGLFVIDQIRFEKDGYEPRGPFGPWYRNLDLHMKLQRTIQLRGGEELAVLLLPDDVFYEPVPSSMLDWDICGPCKLVRIAKPAGATLDVRVSSDNPGLAFGIWEMGRSEAHQVGHGELSASISSAAGEAHILVGTIWRGNIPPFSGAQRLRIRTNLR
jgi:hypothetical protein